MSGIFLIVWDSKDKDKSHILKTTKGGYPHITLVYTGKHLSSTQLFNTASEICLSECFGKQITIKRAYLNSFLDSQNHMRHDVLLEIDDKEYIESLRIQFIKDKYKNSDKFFMRDPHITYGIYETEEEAEQVISNLNQKYLPYTVEITGITID